MVLRMEIGERLKEARLQQDISLDHIQETTKIQKRYLLAIEENNFDTLPGNFYARAFIKEYANAVGLNPNELLEEFKDEVPRAEDANTTQYTRIQRSKKKNASAKTPAFFSFLPTIIVVLLVIGIVFAGWYFYKEALSGSNNDPDSSNQANDEEIIDFSDEDGQNDDLQENDETEEEDESDKDDADQEEDDDVEPEFKVVEKGSGDSPESTLELKNADELKDADEAIKVKLEAENESYTSIKNADEKSYYEGELTPDDSPEEFDASDDDRIYFNIGNAPGITITINDVEVEYPVEKDQFVHQKLWINLTSYDE